MIDPEQYSVAGSILQPVQNHKHGIRWKKIILFTLICLCLASALLSACTSDDGKQEKTISGPSQQTITYSTRAEDVVIRTFYGGGQYGSFSLGPQISIYGDGTYILGLGQQGKISGDELQQLINTFVNTHGLLNVKRTRFSDMPDQNITSLQLTMNGKVTELTYGTFGTQQQSKQDLDEYDRLGKALTALNEALKGELKPYTSDTYALIVRQMYNPVDANPPAPPDSIDFSMYNAARFTCGKVPDATNQNAPSPNHETGCMKYTVPENAILLNNNQVQAFKSSMGDALEGTFQDGENYFTAYLRPLLPDERPRKLLAMFGSNQSQYKEIKLYEGVVPTPMPEP